MLRHFLHHCYALCERAALSVIFFIKPAKGVIVNFFASTCDPCRKELPALNSLVDEFALKNIKVVIIGYKEGFDGFMSILEDLKVEKPVILSDPYGKAGKEYGVYGLPMTIFIGADGKVKEIVRGELTEKVLKEKVLPSIINEPILLFLLDPVKVVGFEI